MSESPVRIISDKKYPDMYRLQWENGDVSVRYWDGYPMPDGINVTSYGMYNLTRAKDILKHWDDYTENMRLSLQLKKAPIHRKKAVHAFK